MAMEESLRTWLHEANISFGNMKCDSSLSDSEKVRLLGSYLFSLSDECSLSDVRNEIRCHTGDIAGLEDDIVAAECLLICAVSSEEKQAFVQQIMEMDPTTQSYLMQAIKGNLEKFRYKPRTIDEDNQVTDQLCAPTEICQNCMQSKQEIEKLITLTKEASVKYEESEAQLRMEIAIQTQCLAKTELQLIDKDNELIEKDKEIERMKVNLLEIQSNSDIKNQTNYEIQILKDQLDVLRPKADRMEAAEAQLEKLRERFDELAGLKVQLKQETQLHTETYKKLLDIEQEVEVLRKCKNQMEEYRIQYAEALITIQDLTIQLQSRDEALQRLEFDHNQLIGGHEQHAIQARKLVAELNATQEQLRDVQHGTGISDGISELNPAIVMELNRLRVENKELADKLNASSLDSLDRLQKRLADQTCVNESLQTKWNDCKRSLSDAQARIIGLTNRLSDLQANHVALQLRMEETSKMAAADSEATLLRSVQQNDTLQRYFQHALALQSKGHVTLVEELVGQINDNMRDLHGCRHEITDLTAQNETLSTDLHTAHVEIAKTNESKVNLQLMYEDRILELKTSHKRTMDELMTESSERLRNEGKRYTDALNEEALKLSVVSSELEDERLKRRRVEREKKIQEAEVGRLKTQCQQLQAGGGSGALSVQMIDEVQKELRGMQEQLEESQREVQFLRSRRQLSDPSASAAVAASIPSSSDDGLPSTPTSTDPNAAFNSIHTHAHTQAHAGGKVAAGATRVRLGDRSGASQVNFSNYLEQAELVDKRVDQLSREKRELLAKNLEENKERMEMAQKLLQSEREAAALKAKTTKLTLELERMERKLLIADEALKSANVHSSSMSSKSIHQKDNAVSKTSDENSENLASQPPLKSRRRVYGEM